MKRINFGITSLFVLLLLLSAWYVTGLLSPAAPSTKPAGIIAALVFLLLSSLGIHLAGRRILSCSSGLAPVVWLVVATASPSALAFTPMHAAALLMVASIIFLLCFCSVSQSLEFISGCFAALGGAALIYPPILWLAPFFMAASMGKAENKAKYLVASTIALVTPVFVSGCIIYLVSGTGTLWPRIAALAQGIITLNPLGAGASAPTIARLSVTVLLTIIATLTVIRRLGSYTIAQYNGFLRLIAILLPLCVLAVLFLGGLPFEMLTAIPAALLLDEYIGAPEGRKARTLLSIILILLLIAERVSCFL